MKNELMLADNIEKKLQEKREPPIFPLTPTHRKELRQLRDRNIGGLKDRLSAIKSLKRDEYEKKYAKQIEADIGKYEGVAEQLNRNWECLLTKINKIIEQRKEFEEKIGIAKLDLKNDWEGLGKLELFSTNRKFSFDREEQSLNIAREEFEAKFDDKFNEISKKIDVIVTQYEEAINFGDWEIVKKLYYMMKGADKFFDKVSSLKI